ncbi:MAG TPA: hypothetical protein VGL97_03135 [Bryobacteraceae bacterium]|jgi:hypothetical protein
MPQSQQEIYDLIRAAVLEKRPIAAFYDGFERLFCPHVLGRNKEGRLQVLCYQFGGKSTRGLEPVGSAANWRCIALAKLESVKGVEGAWRTSANHSSTQTCIEWIEFDAEDPSKNGTRRSAAKAAAQ